MQRFDHLLVSSDGFPRLGVREDVGDPSDTKSCDGRPTVPSDQKIDYVELPVGNFDSMESFYSSTFADYS